MNISKLKSIIKEEVKKLLLENVACDTRNNNPYTGVSSTCPSVPGQGTQTCVANFPAGPTGYEGTCGPSGSSTGGTPTNPDMVPIDRLRSADAPSGQGPIKRPSNTTPRAKFHGTQIPTHGPRDGSGGGGGISGPTQPGPWPR